MCLHRIRINPYLIFVYRVVVVDAQTFLIPNFTYDGQAPDAHFWVGEGKRPGPEVIIQHVYVKIIER